MQDAKRACAPIIAHNGPEETVPRITARSFSLRLTFLRNRWGEAHMRSYRRQTPRAELPPSDLQRQFPIPDAKCYHNVIAYIQPGIVVPRTIA